MANQCKPLLCRAARALILRSIRNQAVLAVSMSESNATKLTGTPPASTYASMF